MRVENFSASMQGSVQVQYSSMEGGLGDVRIFPATDATIALNNPTPTAMAFYELKATVLDAVTLKDCQVAGGDVAVSGDYELELPTPLSNRTSSTDIAWQVDGHSNDSFRVTLGESNATTLTEVPIYQLAMSMRSGAGQWLEAGTFLVANELPHYAAFLDPTREAFSGCAGQNLRKLQQILFERGAIAEELSLFSEVVQGMAESQTTRYFGDVCFGLDYRVVDLYPIDLVDQDGSLEVIIAAECLLRGSEFGSAVALWNPDSKEIIAQHVPIAEMYGQDLSGVGNEVWLDYLQPSPEGGSQSFRETIGLEGGNLVVLKRTPQ